LLPLAAAMHIPGTDVESKLALTEFLLSNRDVQTSARRALDWLSAHTVLEQAIIAIHDQLTGQVLLVAEYGVTSSNVVDFGFRHDDTEHPLVRALLKPDPTYFDTTPNTFHAPLLAPFHAIPLRGEQKAALFARFADVVRATVKGGILVAMAQGTLGGIAFWFLGIHAALLWAVLMAFLSLIPAIGATLVWLPVAIYFLATGAIWQGIGLILYGVLVIGLVDNLLRPFLVGKGTKLPDYVVLISTLGGIEVFGLNGFVIGPLIAAMFMVSWAIFSVSRRTVQEGA